MKRVARTGNAKRPLSFHRLPGLSQLAFSLRPPSLRFALRTFGLPSEACGVPSMPLPVEYSPGCIVFVIFNHRALRTKYLQFFEVSACAALSPTLPAGRQAQSKKLWAHGYWIRQRAIQCRPRTRLLPLYSIYTKRLRVKTRSRELRYQVQNTVS